MSIRTDILTALRSDLNITGNKKVWKSVRQLNELPETDYPSVYVGYGTAVRTLLGDISLWDLPIICIVYFKCDTDTNNSGKLETEAERLIGLYEAVSMSATRVLDVVRNIDLITVTPYVNTGVENKGFILLEYKLTYIGE